MNSLELRHKKELERELDRILGTLVSNYKPLKVIVFGSLANNRININSDIDLLIIKDTDKRYWKRIDEVIHLIHPREAIDIFVLTSQEIEENLRKNNLYLKEILERGEVLYERTD